MIRTKPNNFMRDNRGATSMMVMMGVFFLMVFALMITEAMRYSQSYYALETSVQRSLTAAVEQNMGYAYRADGLLCLYIDSVPATAFDSNEANANLITGNGAYKDFKALLGDDLKVTASGDTFTKKTSTNKNLFIIEITSHEPNTSNVNTTKNGIDVPAGAVLSDSPYMTITGNITFYPMYSNLFGIAPTVTPFTYTSKNFHVAQVHSQTVDTSAPPVWTEG